MQVMFSFEKVTPFTNNFCGDAKFNADNTCLHAEFYTETYKKKRRSFGKHDSSEMCPRHQ